MFKDTNDFITFVLSDQENIKEAKKLLNYCKDRHEMTDLFWDMYINGIIQKIPKPSDILPIWFFFHLLKILK